MLVMAQKMLDGEMPREPIPPEVSLVVIPQNIPDAVRAHAVALQKTINSQRAAEAAEGSE